MRRAFILVAFGLCLTCASARAQTPPAATPAPTPDTGAPADPQPSPQMASTPAPGGDTPAVAPERAGPLRIRRFEKPVVIDGDLSDEAWGGAAVSREFVQIQPGDNIAPSRRTEVLLGYDERNLYIGFRAFDEPGKVRATVAKRDAILEDDNVQIYLDTFNDQRRAYVFIFNPLGAQADGVLTEGRGEDYSVDIVMESRGRVTADGYVVEAAIPFKSLRYEAGKDRPWGVHVFRRIKHLDNELVSWVPISRDRSGLLNQARHVVGFENIYGGRTIELIPSLTLFEAGTRVRTIPRSVVARTPGLLDPGRFVNQPVDYDPGLTAKLGITPTVTLDFALNPDFAQVEADQIVVTANQRFPIFFEEKRPFFLEGYDIFQTPLDPVYTRTIVDPDYAAKLSGKLGRNTFALLAASDNDPGKFTGDDRLEPSLQRFLDKNAYVGVLRLKRDVLKDSSIGLVATTYNFIERHNHLGGFDGRLRLDEQTFITFQALGTHTRRFFRDPVLGRSLYRTGNGFGYSFAYDKGGRNFAYTFTALGRTRDYRADVGFTLRTDTNTDRLVLRYNSDPKPKATLISYRGSLNSAVHYDWRARMQRWDIQPGFGLSLARQTFFDVGLRVGYERLFEEEFGNARSATLRGAFAGTDPERQTYKKSFLMTFSSTPSKKYAGSISLIVDRDVFDFDFGAGPKFPRVSPGALVNPRAALDPGPGDLIDLRASLAYQPTDALRATLNYTRSRLVRDDTKRTAFNDNILALRTTYQFTRYTALRARIDYTSLTENIRGQFLVGWTPNPGTALYIGYNDNLNRNFYSPFTGQFEPGLQRNNRNFFIKMSYLFRRTL